MGISKRRTFLKAGLTSSLALAPAILAAQVEGPDQHTENRLPSGKLQSDVILKADYEQNVKDARELTSLSKAIELDFDRNDQYVLSLNTLKKLDDIEKITKRIRGRIRR